MKNPTKPILSLVLFVVIIVGVILAMPALKGWFATDQPTPTLFVTSAAAGTPTADPAPSPTAEPTAALTHTPTPAPTHAPTPTPTPTSAMPVAIGDAFGGGVVAYILQPGDTGYNASVQHGIIAAQEDQSDGVMWARDAFWATSVPGTLTGIPKGADNTALIVAQQGTGTDFAAGLAHAYHGGGFTDWYLPSIEELEKLFENRAAIGGFVEDSSYWSSSEGSSGSAWRLYFYGSGTQVKDDKGSSYRVRAVRSF